MGGCENNPTEEFFSLIEIILSLEPFCPSSLTPYILTISYIFLGGGACTSQIVPPPMMEFWQGSDPSKEGVELILWEKA